MMNILKNISSILKNENDVVEITEIGNLILISIKEECSFKEYLNYVNSLKGSKKIISKLPLGVYLTDSSNILECKLKKQLIWYERKQDSFWIISRSSDNNELKISLSEYGEEHIDEIQLEIKNNEYKITKLIHDYDFSTCFVKWYPENNEKISQYFSLGKDEAMFYIRYLLDMLEYDKILSDDIISNVYDVVGLKKNFDLKEKVKTYC